MQKTKKFKVWYSYQFYEDNKGIYSLSKHCKGNLITDTDDLPYVFKDLIEEFQTIPIVSLKVDRVESVSM